MSLAIQIKFLVNKFKLIVLYIIYFIISHDEPQFQVPQSLHGGFGHVPYVDGLRPLS